MKTIYLPNQITLMRKVYFLLVFLTSLPGFAAFEISLGRAADCATLTLASSPATLLQSVCIDIPIAPVVCVVGNGGTGASVSGLPDGIEAVYNETQATITISGAPTESGTFAFVITTTGGECSAALNGTIIVNPNVRIRLGLVSDPANGTYCVGSSIYNLVYNISNGATGAFISSGVLPPDVTATLTNNQFKITGYPSAIGIYPYSVTTTGGCSSETRSGVINVVNEAAFQMVSESELLTQSICPGYMEPILFRANDNSRVELLQGNQFFNLTELQGIYTLRSEALLQVGSYPFQIGILDGSCGNPVLSGTIQVLPSPGHIGESCQFTDGTFTTLHFDWQDAIGGATSYEYTYSVDNGPDIHGTTFPPVTELYVTGLVPGQAVHFQYYAVGPFCHQVWSSTCASAPLAVTDFSDEAFDYYPNPVEDIFNIKAKSKISNVLIFNMLGQEMFNGLADSFAFQIDMTDFDLGFYMVKIRMADAFKAVKILKK